VTGRQYTWSGVTANPVEHIADDTEWRMPICGARISAATQRIGDQPSGFAPLCARCQRKCASQ
jgi:hypothetical protein